MHADHLGYQASIIPSHITSTIYSDLVVSTVSIVSSLVSIAQYHFCFQGTIKRIAMVYHCWIVNMLEFGIL